MTSSLFGSKNEQNNDKSNNIFSQNNNQINDIFTVNKTASLFGTNNQSALFGQSLFSNSNQNNLSKSSDKEINSIEKKEPRNNNISKDVKKKCEHTDNYIAYCIEFLENEGGLVCYNCLYDYHKDHNSKCIPIEFNSFEKYKKFYKDHINKCKNILRDKFNEIISILDKYENEEIEDISNLFEQKINLKYELPIEIPFIERFEYAINKKIMSLLDDLLFKNTLNYKLLNLYKNDLNSLKINQNNPNNSETITIKSSTSFNLHGIGIPKIIDNKENSIEIKIYHGNSLLLTINQFENEDNLSFAKFRLLPLSFFQNDEYTIEFTGINNLNYISNDEEYNKNSKIKINSSNAETILACLLTQ